MYRNKLEQQGITVNEDYIIRMDNTEHYDCIDFTSNKVKEMLLLPNRPTAIFASNELMALGVIKAAKELNISIPEELSVVGHDNTVFSIISNPQMTTVDMNPERLGLESAEMMLQLLNNSNRSPRRLTLYPQLVIRESAASI